MTARASNKHTTKERPNVYEIITARIVELLEQGTIPWRKPWSGGDAGQPQNLKSGKLYRGINTFLLATAGYSSPYWVTFKQAQALGGSVRKGEKGFPVIFWNWLDKAETSAAGNQGAGDSASAESRRMPYIRYYTAFNAADQCEGLVIPAAATALPTFSPIAQCEALLASLSGGPSAPTIRHGEPRAYYRLSTDTVNMPRPELFDRPELYYSVLFHELTHSTGHATRLSRSGVTDEVLFGSHEYSKEELIAEMGAAFLSGHFGIEQSTLDDSAAYLFSWIRVLRGDAKLLVQAAAAAQKAADLLLNRTFTEASPDVGDAVQDVSEAHEAA